MAGWQHGMAAAALAVAFCTAGPAAAQVTPAPAEGCTTLAEAQAAVLNMGAVEVAHLSDGAARAWVAQVRWLVPLPAFDAIYIIATPYPGRVLVGFFRDDCDLLGLYVEMTPDAALALARRVAPET